MRHRLAGCLVVCVLLAAAPGCLVLERGRPLPVLVRDADTKKPVAAAEVRLSDPLATSVFASGSLPQTTGADGIARLQAAPSAAGLVVQVSAAGYLSEEKVVSTEVVQALEPPHLFEDVEKRPAGFVVELYADEPRPAVELVLPASFLGLVKVEVQAQPGLPRPPGQRRFRFEVPASGVVRVIGPDLFRHLGSPDFVARYRDGPVLGQDVGEGQVGFWCLESKGQHYTFLVGSRREYEFHQPRLMDETGDRPIIGGGRRGGRGGRHGRNQTADPGKP